MTFPKVRRIFSVKTTEALIDRLLWLLAAGVVLMALFRADLPLG